MSNVILPTAGKHQCSLPWRDGGYGSTGLPDGTLASCTQCGRWWFSTPCYESFGPTSWWAPVRWYHRRLRRRIEEQA